MTIVRTLTTLGGLLAATLALAQPPTPPAAPAPPAPASPQAPTRPRALMPAPAPPAPVLAPTTPTPAAAPLPPDPPFLDADAIDRLQEQAERAAEKAAAAIDAHLPEIEEQAARAAMLDSDAIDRIQEQAERAAEKAAQFQFDFHMPDFDLVTPKAMAFADQFAAKPWPTPVLGGMAPFQKIANVRWNGSEDSLYNAGKRALDNFRWDEALECFNQVASRAGARADAAWYWKAYALNKLGRRDEAVAALAELRKTYPQSRWLEESKALELEIRQAAGKPVSPNSQSDEELKLIAINSIMQSDPDSAIPLLEKLLKTSTSPKLKERAIYVLAQSSSPRAHQVLESIARGGANPDLQVKAIEYMRQSRRQGEMNPNLLPEIYGATSDTAVKRAILQTYANYREYDHLLAAARNEKNHDLWIFAVQRLGDNTGQPELWQLYPTVTNVDDKVQVIDTMRDNGNVDKLSELLRNETDPKVRAAVIHVLAQQKGNTADTLVSAYSHEQDEKIRQTIVDSLYNQRNAKALVELARAEKDSKMKLRIVDRLGNMKSKEASDYLMEILSK